LSATFIRDALHRQRRRACIRSLPRHGAERFHVREAPQRLRANWLEGRLPHDGGKILLIAQCSERKARGVSALAARDPCQTLRRFGADPFVGIGQRHGGQHGNVVDARRGGTPHARIRVLARQRRQRRDVLRIRAELLDGSKPDVGVR
jgi:hypothetical protein